jgi:hypothetical protein
VTRRGFTLISSLGGAIGSTVFAPAPDGLITINGKGVGGA